MPCGHPLLKLEHPLFQMRLDTALTFERAKQKTKSGNTLFIGRVRLYGKKKRFVGFKEAKPRELSI